MSWRDQTAPNSSKVWKAKMDAKDSRGLSRFDKALDNKKGLYGLLETKGKEPCGNAKPVRKESKEVDTDCSARTGRGIRKMLSRPLGKEDVRQQLLEKIF